MTCNKRKPFNLAEALAGKPVVTRSGRPVTQLVYFSKSSAEQKLVGLESGGIEKFHDNGSYQLSKRESSMDLFMATERKTMWFGKSIEIVQTGNNNPVYMTTNLYLSYADAKTYADTCKLTYEILSVEVEV